MISVIATICLQLACRDVLVTTSQLDPNLSMQWCSSAAQPQLADWMAKNWPGYTLAGWKCELGSRQRAA
jgi:hypothetical protein